MSEKDKGRPQLSSWVKKLSGDQLDQLRDAVAAELKRRDKEESDKKSPDSMDDREFENWKTRIFEESKSK